MANPAIGLIDCPACGLEAQIRETKKQKPYIVCDDCGMQAFARGHGAATALRAKMRPLAASPSNPQPVEQESDMAALKKPAAKKPAAKKPAAKPAPKAAAPAEPKPAAREEGEDDFRKFLGF